VRPVTVTGGGARGGRSSTVAEQRNRWLGREVIIALLGATAAVVVPGIFIGFGRALLLVWNFLTGSVSLPVWAIGAVAIAFLLSLYKNLKTALTTGGGSSFLLYTQDVFFGIRWRWKYYGNELGPVVAFCPRCDTRLLERDEYLSRRVGYASGSGILFYCDHCSWESQPLEGTHDDVIERVGRQIDRKIRNKEWITEIVEKHARRDP